MNLQLQALAVFLFLAPVQDDASKEARALIEKLRSDTPSELQEASRKLKDMGKAALPELEKARKDPDPEVATRVRQLLDFMVEVRLGDLVALFVRARELKENLPTQRFWVWINDQPANPWNTATGKAMTWKLRDVKGKVCLVGSDEATNAYQGDTSLEKSLPLLCIKRSRLKAPEGVNPNDFYAGWSGGEIRLSKPVPGRELTSREIADALAVQEFGEGWRMAEFHDTSLGGWAWWAYWAAPPK